MRTGAWRRPAGAISTLSLWTDPVAVSLECERLEMIGAAGCHGNGVNCFPAAYVSGPNPATGVRLFLHRARVVGAVSVLISWWFHRIVGGRLTGCGGVGETGAESEQECDTG